MGEAAAQAITYIYVQAQESWETTIPDPTPTHSLLLFVPIPNSWSIFHGETPKVI